MKNAGTRTVAWVLALMMLCFVLPMGALALDGSDRQTTESTQATQEQTESPSATNDEPSSAAVEEATGAEVGDQSDQSNLESESQKDPGDRKNQGQQRQPHL